MSCDFGVWFPDKRLTDDEAEARYARLCDGQVEGEVLAHPSVAAFYAELTARHPEIDDIPEDRVGDTEYCPWSIAMDRSDGHVIMACVWSRADYVERLVRELAKKHGLALFDPQSGRVFYADAEEPTGPRRRRWWNIFALLLCLLWALFLC
ncbi:MAG: hypothetical protein L0212_12405, partial [Acidobacteria bacterium]|nr:hypothetical protein [Acidobacteriota bacterium]